MKKSLLLLIVLFSFLISSCLKLEEDKRFLSFWTGMTIEEETVLYINDIPVGHIKTYEVTPDCEDLSLVSVPLENKEDMVLTVRNASHDIWEIGVINLYSVANGISIKPVTDSSLFITKGLDDKCTMIELSW